MTCEHIFLGGEKRRHFPKWKKMDIVLCNLFNVWLNRRQLDPHICLCIQSVARSHALGFLGNPLWEQKKKKGKWSCSIIMRLILTSQSPWKDLRASPGVSGPDLELLLFPGGTHHEVARHPGSTPVSSPESSESHMVHLSLQAWGAQATPSEAAQPPHGAKASTWLKPSTSPTSTSPAALGMAVTIQPGTPIPARGVPPRPALPTSASLSACSWLPDFGEPLSSALEPHIPTTLAGSRGPLCTSLSSQLYQLAVWPQASGLPSLGLSLPSCPERTMRTKGEKLTKGCGPAEESSCDYW